MRNVRAEVPRTIFHPLLRGVKHKPNLVCFQVDASISESAKIAVNAHMAELTRKCNIQPKGVSNLEQPIVQCEKVYNITWTMSLPKCLTAESTGYDSRQDT